MEELKQAKMEELLKWIKIKGYSKIKARHDDFETPKGFLAKKNDDRFIPDASAMKFGRKFYFEIALKMDENIRNIKKWKLLSTLSEMKNGTLYLFAPRGHKSFVERVVKNRGLNAEVISI